ncbi:P-aminobenzoate N-oxygenase AurF family protein [Mycobacterium intracellulare 1956]|uniref:p-aminobenzoate N-oxygenase AurF family protein n=1 Tax=Mycobacterium intracellulare 1956 TaxID=1299331 RepID=X8CQN0_MYCIT|nr:P-aminobenzoate N-oxygenase AurF family protein [Mycobacterium intracellulare 1956]
MEVRDDADYVNMLATLSEGSVRRNFNPYTDIDWDSPEFAVTENDPRWILPETDPLGRHPWYLAQSDERKIKIGMWRQANVAKVGLHFESILIRGLMNYTFWVPNGSPEYRYCLHESVEECNHTMMFQEMVNRIGADVPACRGCSSGCRRWFRWWRAAAGGVLHRRARRRGAHRPHAEKCAARRQVPAPDHGTGDGDPRRRGSAPHLVRPRVPAQAGAGIDQEAAILDRVVPAADHEGALPRDCGTAQGFLAGVRHPARGQEGTVLPVAGIA